ncbi:MAG: 50S ribosomal protein L9 [Armatimonadetes bacterium]|nr:50S ribosomal protein L9 [Armatimonadota bacterium]
MKLILTQPVTKLGKPGDVVTVADGYGRNYLIPRQLAIPASAGNLKQAEKLAAEHDRYEQRVRDDAESVAARLRETPVTVSARAGESERLYGSITSSDIADAIQEQLGVEVDRRKVELAEPIRELGEHTVPIRLHSDVTAEVQVRVQPIEA